MNCAGEPETFYDSEYAEADNLKNNEFSCHITLEPAPMKPAFELKNNRINKQFEFHVEGQVAKIEYLRAKEKIVLTHTEVPDKLGGQGIGSQLAEAVLREIERQDLTLVPLCPFIAGYLKEHPHWNKLVLKGITIS